MNLLHITHLFLHVLPVFSWVWHFFCAFIFKPPQVNVKNKNCHFRSVLRWSNSSQSDASIYLSTSKLHCQGYREERQGYQVEITASLLWRENCASYWTARSTYRMLSCLCFMAEDSIKKKWTTVRKQCWIVTGYIVIASIWNKVTLGVKDTSRGHATLPEVWWKSILETHNVMLLFGWHRVPSTLWSLLVKTLRLPGDMWLNLLVEIIWKLLCVCT